MVAAVLNMLRRCRLSSNRPIFNANKRRILSINSSSNINNNINSNPKEWCLHSRFTHPNSKWCIHHHHHSSRWCTNRWLLRCLYPQLPNSTVPSARKNSRTRVSKTRGLSGSLATSARKKRKMSSHVDVVTMTYADNVLKMHLNNIEKKTYI